MSERLTPQLLFSRKSLLILIFLSLFAFIQWAGFYKNIIEFSARPANLSITPLHSEIERLPEISGNQLDWLYLSASLPQQTLLTKDREIFDISENGRFIAFRGHNYIEAWNHEKRQIIFSKELEPQLIALTPRDSMIAWTAQSNDGNSNQIFLKDLSTDEAITSISISTLNHPIQQLQFLLTGDLLAYGDGQVIHIISVESEDIVFSTSGQQFDITTNGQQMVVVQDNIITVHDLINSTIVFEVENPFPNPIQHIQYNPRSSAFAIADSEQLAVIHQSDNDVRITNVASVDRLIVDMDFHPKGRILAVAHTRTSLFSLNSPQNPTRLNNETTIISQFLRSPGFLINDVEFHSNGKLLHIAPASSYQNKFESWAISTQSGAMNALRFNLGLTLTAFGYGWMLILGFQKRFWHGLLILIFPPLAGFVYGLLNFQLAKLPLLFLLFGFGFQLFAVWI